ARFALGGGRLVLAGASTEVILQGATGEPIMWEETTPIDPLVLGESGIGAVRTLAGDRGGRWIGAEGVETLLADPAGRPLVVTAPVGEGVVVALADPELLHNANLASEDNAALALELIGGSGRQVVFV